MLNLTVVTPEREFLYVSCSNVVLPGKSGEMQVLPGHVSLMAEIVAGLISYQENNQPPVRFMVGEGVVEIDHDQVNVLCEQACYKDEVDKTLLEKLSIELKEKIKKADNDDMEQRRLANELSRNNARQSLFD